MDHKTAPPPYDYGAAPPQEQPYPAGQAPYFSPLPQQPGPYPAGAVYPAGAYNPPPQQQYQYQPPPPTVVHVVSDPHMYPHAHTTTTTTVIVKNEVNHCMHCCISIFFPPWIFVWIFLCLTN